MDRLRSLGWGCCGCWGRPLGWGWGWRGCPGQPLGWARALGSWGCWGRSPLWLQVLQLRHLLLASEQVRGRRLEVVTLKVLGVGLHEVRVDRGWQHPGGRWGWGSWEEGGRAGWDGVGEGAPPGSQNPAGQLARAPAAYRQAWPRRRTPPSPTFLSRLHLLRVIRPHARVYLRTAERFCSSSSLVVGSSARFCVRVVE